MSQPAAAAEAPNEPGQQPPQDRLARRRGMPAATEEQVAAKLAQVTARHEAAAQRERQARQELHEAMLEAHDLGFGYAWIGRYTKRRKPTMQGLMDSLLSRRRARQPAEDTSEPAQPTD